MNKREKIAVGTEGQTAAKYRVAVLPTNPTEYQDKFDEINICRGPKIDAVGEASAANQCSTPTTE